jgi:hypothetical protein
MTETSHDWWKEWSIADLRFLPSESFVDDDGEACHCIYSFSLDAVTSVGDSALQELRDRGIQEMGELPQQRQ